MKELVYDLKRKSGDAGYRWAAHTLSRSWGPVFRRKGVSALDGHPGRSVSMNLLEAPADP